MGALEEKRRTKVGKEGSRREGGGPFKGCLSGREKRGAEGAFERKKCETPPFFF